MDIVALKEFSFERRQYARGDPFNHRRMSIGFKRLQIMMDEGLIGPSKELEDPAPPVQPQIVSEPEPEVEEEQSTDDD